MILQAKGSYIFGGTFDPFHQGHVGVLREVWGDGRTLVLAPTAQNPFKAQSSTSFALRLEMIKLVLGYEGIAFSEEIEVGHVYLCKYPYLYAEELVSFLREKIDSPIHWVVGPDLAKEVTTWKNWDSLNIGVHVADCYADDLHAAEIRLGKREAHPAICDFLQANKLY